MPHYRRLNIEGGTFFFTVTLADRASDLLVRHIDRLRGVYRSVQWRIQNWFACPTRRCRRARSCVGDPVRRHAIFWPVVPEEVKVWWRAILESHSAGAQRGRPNAPRMKRRASGALLRRECNDARCCARLSAAREVDMKSDCREHSFFMCRNMNSIARNCGLAAVTIAYRYDQTDRVPDCQSRRNDAIIPWGPRNGGQRGCCDDDAACDRSADPTR
jgi:hypothetical protein